MSLRPFVALATATLAMLSACSSDSADPESGAVATPTGEEQQPETSVDAREDFFFQAPDELLEATPVVVDGTVRSVSRGRIVGPPEDPLQFRELIVDVNEVLLGDMDAQTVTLEEEGWTGTDLQRSVSINGSRWANADDRAIWFLIDKGGAEQERYRLINSQGRFFLQGSDRLLANRADPMSIAVAAAGERRLRQAISRFQP